MSFYAVVIVVETDDPQSIPETMPANVTFGSEPWEVRPINDLTAEQEAGKWIAAGEEGGYYPNADPEFDTDSTLEQRS